jgi:hypothetical protein
VTKQKREAGGKSVRTFRSGAEIRVLPTEIL